MAEGSAVADLALASDVATSSHFHVIVPLSSANRCSPNLSLFIEQPVAFKRIVDAAWIRLGYGVCLRLDRLFGFIFAQFVIPGFVLHINHIHAAKVDTHCQHQMGARCHLEKNNKKKILVSVVPTKFSHSFRSADVGVCCRHTFLWFSSNV